MNLKEIVADLPRVDVFGPADIKITSIAYDSRRVQPEALFVAVPGFKADGHSYLKQALANGAAAAVVQADRRDMWEPLARQAQATVVVVDDSRCALAAVAAAFYGHPGRKLRVVGVTGTDGKTTTSWLTAAVLEAAGYCVGLLSTASAKVGGRVLPNPDSFTTPEAPQVQALLAEMVAAGADYAVVEATSHGLALHRLDGCEFDVAVFTNLASDHTDFHGSQEEYMRAKGRLFSMLDEAATKEEGNGLKEGAIGKAAILNADDPSADYFRSQTSAGAITYGVQSAADVRAEDVSLAADGSRFKLVCGGPAGAGDALALLRLPGLFNIYNGLAAAAVGVSQGVELGAITEALAGFSGVPGRMEYVDEGQPFKVVIDFAHAPNALRTVLAFLRSQTSGRLIAVFGCIGERDQQRRFAMGQAAGELADYTAVTNDNPFSENPLAIMAEIEHGLEAAGRSRGDDFVVMPDRREAIRHALAMARAGDTVLLAGKGHETSITIGSEVIPWDERAVARELLR